jgi:hypothetical protein
MRGVKVRPYEGLRNLESWLAKFELHCLAAQNTNEAQLKLAKGFLCGHARDWYWQYSQKIEKAERQWEDVKKSLVSQFQKSQK